MDLAVALTTGGPPVSLAAMTQSTPETHGASSDGLHASQAYRPDIDGLRAIAVLVVCLFHARIPGFEGGFVGVDVFFVISGFLITGIILRERDAGHFSYLGFWERRLRRIAPALLVVAVAASLYTLVIRTPVEARLFGQSISFLAIFASNHFFWQETGYFADAADRYLLLHTWSLAVEEQFYLLFPALLGALYVAGARLTIRAMAALALVSFIACGIMQPIDERAAFFLSPFRVWELLIGALCALWGWRAARPVLRPGVGAEALAVAGLGLVIGSVALLDADQAFPFWTALAPVAGTAALVLSGMAGSLVSRLLAGRGLVAIGLISYSLYLWHWPVLMAAEDLMMRQLSHGEALMALAGAGVSAVLSYRFVEQPFRRRGSTGAPIVARPPLFGVAAAGAAALIGLGVFLQETRGWPERWPEAASRMLSDEARRFGVDRGACRDASSMLPEPTRAGLGEHFCRTGAEDAPLAAFFWGDSHVNALWPAIDAAAKEVGATALLATKGACPPVLPAPSGESGVRLLDKPACRRHGEAVLAAIDAIRPERMTLMAHWPAYTGSPEEAAALASRLEATLDALTERGIEARLLINAPSYQRHVPTALSRAIVFGGPSGIDTSRAAHEARIAPILQAVEQAGAPAVLAEPPIRLDQAFCDQSECRLMDSELPFYRDANHLNHRAAIRLAPMLSSSFGRSTPPAPGDGNR